MKKIQVIGVPNSKKVRELSEFLKKNKVKYTLWSIDDSDVKRRLLDDEKFTEKYCDVLGCMSKLPMIRLDDTGEYIAEDLFKGDVLQVDATRRVIGLG
ncbi:MAG: hypothetical protein Q6373_003435 [Candidatus Sigynarchaeota archaeon]